MQAASGFAALSIPITDAPSYAPSVICDKISGLAISNAILAGLFDRQRTGEGQEIEVPMFETAIEFNLMETFAGAAFEPPLGKPGYARIQVRERKPFRTADGFACIMPYSDKNWQDFFAFIGRHDLIGDARFLLLSERSSWFPFLYGLIAEAAPLHTTDEWVAFCDEANIPCMPVIDLADIGDDPHVKAVGLFETVEHPYAGKYHSIRRPASYSAAPFELRYHAPMLGQHSREVLLEAGLTESEISDALCESDPKVPDTQTL
ncbi:CoA transferase [Sphingobium phenoxybenzoativorans]|uniref:CoA transferase n=1 Tax=Sphingobium phenoxybenzoativorans TaxID=1592790 RepID=UPI0024847573|nr:CoA transferase [Sphingobium phenoxybenzoativorans]